MTFQAHNHPPVLSAMRTFGRNNVMPWLVSLVLIAQAMIPLQSHTRLAVDESGMVVEICTLDGVVEKTVSTQSGIPTLIDHPSDPDSDTDPTPAMTFSQLMAEALLALDAAQPSWLALQVSEPAPAVIGTLVRRPHRLASIRAPPSLV